MSTPVVHNEARDLHGLDLWRVAITEDVNALPAERRAELLEWLEGLGVPTRHCIPRLVVTQSGVDRRYRVHVSVQVRDDDSGRTCVDYAANRVYTEPLVITVDSYPAWLPGHITTKE